MTDDANGYKILVLGPFAPVPEERYRPDFIPVDLYSIDDAVNTVSPVLYLHVPPDLCPDGAVTLKFQSMKDFRPEVLLKSNAFLSDVAKDGTLCPGAVEAAEKKSAAENSPVDDILSMVAVPDEPAATTLSERTADGTGLARLMTSIYTHPDFRQTESAWRGIQIMVKKGLIKGFEKLNVRLAPVSLNSLEQVLEEVENLSSDERPHLVLIDLQFDNTPVSIQRLENVLAFADRMMVPVCIELRSAFFKIDTWDQFDKLPYINNHLDDMAYAKFRKLRQNPGAAWVMACCNPFAARPANAHDNKPLMVSPVWAMGTLCALSVQHNGWPLEFSRYTRYQVTDLPMADSSSGKPASTQILLSDDRIHQLIEAGITPLAGAVKKDIAFIPRQVSLAGESLIFQLFFSRIIETLFRVRENSRKTDSPENEIKSGILHLFSATGHEPPAGISVHLQDETPGTDAVYLISFAVPPSLNAGMAEVTFSFSW